MRSETPVKTDYLMSRRLYFMLPDADSCKSLVADLEQHGIREQHFHVIGSLTQTLEGLPEAGILQKTELAHGLEWGTSLGGVAGLLGGVLAVTFPPAGLVIGGGALLAGTVAGAGFGALVSSLLASHEHNHKLDAFERGIEQGQLLLMIDVPRKEVEAVRELIFRHHPEVQIGVAKVT